MKRLSRPLLKIEFDILGALFFTEPFEKILEDIRAPEKIVADSLKFLIDNKLVSPMKWDAHKKTYTRSFFYDGDNMHAYRYMITKEGLMVHSTK